MEIDVQELLVALVVLVPGFISTGILRAFKPTRYASDLEWVVTSFLIAICLNALLLTILVLVESGDPSIKAWESVAILKNLPLQKIVVYMTALYAGAVAWGILAGMFPAMSPRALLNRIGLVAFGEHPSVWNRILDLTRPKDRPVTWLKITRKDGTFVFGHLRHCSENINKDELFELYLTDVQVSLPNQGWMPIAGDGVYYRLMPEEPAELHFRARNWKPQTPPD